MVHFTEDARILSRLAKCRTYVLTLTRIDFLEFHNYCLPPRRANVSLAIGDGFPGSAHGCHNGVPELIAPGGWPSTGLARRAAVWLPMYQTSGYLLAVLINTAIDDLQPER